MHSTEKINTCKDIRMSKESERLMKQKTWVSVRITEGAFNIKIKSLETLQMLIVVNMSNKIKIS